VSLSILKPLHSVISKRFQVVLAAAVCVMTVLGAPLGVQAMGNSEWDSLSKGQVVIKQNAPSGNAVPSVEAKILIAKPPEKVWSVVADPETLMSQERKVQKVKVLSRSANKQNVAFSVSMTRLFPTFNYVLLQELSPPNLLRFHRISGSFKDIQGSWKLAPVDNGSKTILTYTLQLDPGPLIPRSLLLGAVKSDLPDMMRNAKMAIDKAAH
jgi:ribosome-associated toxin RatA of RatAB toxin-antitoxin module